MNKKIISLSLCILSPLMHLAADSGSFDVDGFGVRAGVDREPSVSLTSYEMYGLASTPWSCEIFHSQLSVEFEGAVGGISGEGKSSFYARFAPQLRLDFEAIPISFIAGAGPAVFSEHVFGGLDLGGSFQFFDYLGVDWDIGENWVLGYRYQHISNAGIHDNNPGLNFHALSVGYTF